MRQVWVVLRREYLERVKTKGFILSTIAMPLLMVGLMGLTAFMGMQAVRSDRSFVVVDLTGRLGEEVVARVGRDGYDVELADRGQDLDALDQRVEDEELEAYLVLDDLALSEGAFVYRGAERPGGARRRVLESAVVAAALEAQLADLPAAGAVRALIGDGDRLEYEPVVAPEEGEDAEAAEIARVSATVTGIAGAIMLYFTMLLYGAYVLRAVLDEKRNRVVEVVISSVTPWRLMLGKILGVGSMGLTQVGIWVGSAAALALLGAPAILTRWPSAQMGSVLEHLPGAAEVAIFGAFFLLGYFLYASLFAAVGAMCSKEEDAQQAQFPVIMLLVIPFMMQMMTIEGGGFAWMDWAALFPYFSPVMMYPRAVAGDVSTWMVALSLVFMVLALVGTAWVAGRIYRVGILMQGKRPTLRELLRWVRAG